MIKGSTVYKAGENEVYRWGRKAQERARAFLTPNEQGFYSIPCDGGKYWTIGTSKGRYGEFCKVGNEFLSVNSRGNAWAKVGTAKEEVFKQLVNGMLATMQETMQNRFEDLDDCDD